MSGSVALDPRLGGGPTTSEEPHQAKHGHDGETGASTTSTPARAGSSVLGAPTPSTPDEESGTGQGHATGAGTGTGDVAAGDGGEGADGEGGLERKQRACESCRSLKVRCEPPPLDGPDPHGPCKRCAKAKRKCVIRPPTKRREKRSENRISELEKKINSLTQHLSNAYARAPSPTSTGGGAGSVGLSGADDRTPMGTATGPARRIVDDHSPAAVGMPYGDVRGSNVAPRQWGPAASGLPMGDVRGDSAVGSSSRVSSFPPERQTGYPPMVMAGQKRKLADRQDPHDDENARRPGPPVQRHGSIASSLNGGRDQEATYFDVIDRGILTTEQAVEFFARYTDRMVPHLPAVIFPPGTTASEVRETKPTLFLAIMAAASSELPKLQRQLVKELMQVLAEKIIVTGEKTIDLVQALSVAVIWYWPPEHFEELKFYQLVHMGAVMAIDIGLGRKTPNKMRHIPYGLRDHPFRRNTPPDPTSLESRRAWLTCFFLASNTSMALHRPNLIRWTPFMDESVKILTTSPEAAPTDKYFCHLVWTHRMAEEVGNQFSMDEPTVAVNLVEPRTLYALRKLEREMEVYKAGVEEEGLMQPTLKLGFGVLSLYMHEIAIHADKADEIKHPYTPDQLQNGIVDHVPKLHIEHVNALAACLEAIDAIFTTFLAMPVESIRCLPVFNFVRVAYAVVVLIKMYFSAMKPQSELGRVIRKEEMKVDYYLDGLLEKFRQTAAEDRSRPAAKFLVVLVMLRSWFLKQGSNLHRAAAGRNGGGNAGAGGGRSDGDEPPVLTEAWNTPTPKARPAELARPRDGAERRGAASAAEDARQFGSTQGNTGPGMQSDFRANTPLQLLSQVAEVASSNNAASTGPHPARSSGSLPSLSGGIASAVTPEAWSQIRSNFQPFIYDSGGRADATDTTGDAATTTASEDTIPGGPPSGPTPGSMGAGGAVGPNLWPYQQSLGMMMDMSDFGFEGFDGLDIDSLTAGLGAGASPTSLENGMRYVMNSTSEQWLGTIVDGMPGGAFQF